MLNFACELNGTPNQLGGQIHWFSSAYEFTLRVFKTKCSGATKAKQPSNRAIAMSGGCFVFKCGTARRAVRGGLPDLSLG